MNLHDQIKAKKKLVSVRSKLLNEALDELSELVEALQRQTKQIQRNRPLKVKEMMRLLEKSNATQWRWGVTDFDNYYQLWEWTRENKPELLKQLEENFENFVK